MKLRITHSHLGLLLINLLVDVAEDMLNNQLHWSAGQSKTGECYDENDLRHFDIRFDPLSNVSGQCARPVWRGNSEAKDDAFDPESFLTDDH